MPARRIRQLGDPVLREISTPVHQPDIALTILQDLRDTLHEFQRTHGFGRGISAVQIGVPQRIIYMEFEGASYSLINPIVEYPSDERTGRFLPVVRGSSNCFELWDDCFSFPDLLVRLARWQNICIRYTDEHGADQVLAATGPLSELIQHEMDHLDGILAIDRALDANSLCTREEWERRYARNPTSLSTPVVQSV